MTSIIIEVLKGSAGAALFGADATNGVIQIFTKKGYRGAAPMWTVTTTGGFDRSAPTYPTRLYPNFTGPDGTRGRDLNKTLIKSGIFQDYHADVSGGASGTTFFVSGGLTRQVGSVPADELTRGTMRANGSLQLIDKLHVDAQASYARTNLNTKASRGLFSILASLSDPRTATAARPYGTNGPLAQTDRLVSFQDANRYIGSVSATLEPNRNLTTAATLGVDVTNDNRPVGLVIPDSAGSFAQENRGYRHFTSYTVDARAEYRRTLSRMVSAEIAVGAQRYSDVDKTSISTSRARVIDEDTTESGFSRWSMNRTMLNFGSFAQGRLSVAERLYVTAGFRVDGVQRDRNHFQYQRYPKIDLAYHLGESSLLPKVVSSLKLRGAWGRSGTIPALPISFAYSIAPGTLSLPTPEIGSSIDVGADAGFLDDRLVVEATYYRQTASNLNAEEIRRSPTGTFVALGHGGKVVNAGWETSIDWLTVRSRDFEWRNAVRADGNNNKIVELNPATTGTGTMNRIGYPVEGIWMRQPVSYDAATRTWIGSDTAVYVGPSLPTFNFSYTPLLRWRRLQFMALVTTQRGAYFVDRAQRDRFVVRTGDAYLALLGPNGESTAAADSARSYWGTFGEARKRDNVRLRQISLAFDLPVALVSRLRLGPTTITATAFNIRIWTKCRCQDPEVASYASPTSVVATEMGLLDPPPRQYRLTIRSRF